MEDAGCGSDGCAGFERFGSQRAPRKIGDVFGGAVIDNGVVRTFKEVVAILDAGNGNDIGGNSNVFQCDVGKTDMPDLAFISELGQGSDTVCEWHVRIRAVQLVEIDPIHAETAQAGFTKLSQAFRFSIWKDAVRSGFFDTALGCDDEGRTVRGESVCKEFLVESGSVGVSGIEELNAQFSCEAE